jgi:hypothetical protein
MQFIIAIELLRTTSWETFKLQLWIARLLSKLIPSMAKHMVEWGE